jgi:hypothetical protein
MYLTALFASGQAWVHDGLYRLRSAIMTIPTIEYRGYELRAYSHQVFPLHRDPYAKGRRQFSSFVRIDTVPSREVDAIELAMQYGKDIVDGKVEATEL